jgi:hypothetical protein
MLNPYPEYTKQTKCNNHFDKKQDIYRPILSKQSLPLFYNHENYDLERKSIPSRNNNKMDNFKEPVQIGFQNSFHQFMNVHQTDTDKEINKYYERNPINTRRDLIEKTRNNDKQYFMKQQSGVLSQNFSDLKIENTRKERNMINTSNYIPMGMTMAIPKDKI